MRVSASCFVWFELFEKVYFFTIIEKTYNCPPVHRCVCYMVLGKFGIEHTRASTSYMMATCRKRPFGSGQESGQVSRVESVLEDAPKFVNFKENNNLGIKEMLSSTVLSAGIDNWSANRTLSKTVKDSEREDR